jgi:nucleoside-diphosphate-sugar epimerase
MKWLIAGFGDLGQSIARTLGDCAQTADTPVIALKRKRPAPGLPKTVTWLKADLSDRRTLEALPLDITHVVYCAAPKERDEVLYRATYLNGIQNLVAVLGRRAPQARVLFVSSTAVYGASLTGQVTEDTPALPSAFNGRIMLQTEQWLETHWPGSLVLRLSGIYGPERQSLINQIKSGLVRVPASQDYWANRIHIDDAARAAIHLLMRPGLSGVYIGTDSTPVPLRDLYTSIARQIGAPEPATGSPTPMMGKKRLSNLKLIQSGFDFRWPDSRDGYAKILSS